MAIHFLNCFTCNARFPRGWETGTLCLLVETDQGPVLVDTGLGLDDYAHPTWFTRLFRLLTIMPFEPQEAAVNQVQRLGYQSEDVRHIVLTHMHFDHCGGLPDFPHAQVHVNRLEYDAFLGPPRTFYDLAYIHRHIAHGPQWVFHQTEGEKWFDFDAIRLPFEPEMWLIPLYYHTRGHCAVAIKTETGWRLHCGDAAGDFRKDLPQWAVRLVLGPHTPRLRAFTAAHPEVQLTASHMFKDFFTNERIET